MKNLLFLTIILLAGCGSVNVTKYADGSYEASSKSLFKDVKDVHIEKTTDGYVNASLGASVVNKNAESAWMLVCTINPALPLCQVNN